MFLRIFIFQENDDRDDSRLFLENWKTRRCPEGIQHRRDPSVVEEIHFFALQGETSLLLPVMSETNPKIIKNTLPEERPLL